eukprot:gene6991-7548_t
MLTVLFFSLLVSKSQSAAAPYFLYTIAGFVSGTAGSGVDKLPGPATALNKTGGLWLSSEKLYFADINNHVIRFLNDSGILNILAGTIDTGNRAIRRITNGVMMTVVGNGTAGCVIGVHSLIKQPFSCRLAEDGNIIFTDTLCKQVLKLDVLTSRVSVVYSSSSRFVGGTPASVAKLISPRGLSTDSTGVIYYTDDNMVRKTVNSTTNSISLFWNVYDTGGSSSATPLGSAQLKKPSGVYVDAQGSVFVADTSNSVLRHFFAGETLVYTFVGAGSSYSEGTIGTVTKIGQPVDIVGDSSGLLYFSDQTRNKICKLVPAVPTIVPTPAPTVIPSFQPTRPTAGPTTLPTVIPTVFPTKTPSLLPTARPSTLTPNSNSGIYYTELSTGFVRYLVAPNLLPTASPTAPSSLPTSGPSTPTSVPSRCPSLRPSNNPTSSPSQAPSSRPSSQPSASPSPSAIPTSNPSSSPSPRPTTPPTTSPTNVFSSAPSGQPTLYPSSIPSSSPSCQPSSTPSGFPTSKPSLRPSGQPSAQPSSVPTVNPTSLPTSAPSLSPSSLPTSQPSSSPSQSPSTSPSVPPSVQPSAQPTLILSDLPTSRPTAYVAPTSHPFTDYPTVFLTNMFIPPTRKPTRLPSASPSLIDTTQPTSMPSSLILSDLPTSKPTAYVVPTSHPFTDLPTAFPTNLRIPSAAVSSQPSFEPATPTNGPTNTPSATPSSTPTSAPSTRPSLRLSNKPTSSPSQVPSSRPSAQPSGHPTNRPTLVPSSQPPSQPSASPSMLPSVLPSAIPTSNPSSQPKTGFPTSFPSNSPSPRPTTPPTSSPTNLSSSKPSGQPTLHSISVFPTLGPFSRPSSQPSVQHSFVPHNSLYATPSSTVVVILDAPSFSGYCSPVLLDLSLSSGHGGRGWSFSFIKLFSSNLSEDLNQLQAYIDQEFILTRPFSIPAKFFVAGTIYSFYVQLYNYIGSCGFANRSVEITSVVLPTVMILGSQTVSITSRQTLQLISSVSVNDCLGDPSSVSYEWIVHSSKSDKLSLQSTAKDVSRFLLPPYSFPALGTYLVSLAVRVNFSSSAVSALGKAQIVVNVARGNVVALIKGEGSRMAKVGQTIVLDASESYDEEQFPSKLIYHWYCLEIWPNYGENCTSRFNFANGSIDSHNFSVIVKESHRQVRWTVKVREGQRSANTSIIMDLVKPRAPTINFQSSAVSGVINAESSMKISAMIYIPENFSGVTTWITDDLNLSSISLTPLFQTVRVLSISQTITTYLVLPSRSLKSGTIYTFSLLVTIVDANMNHTSAQTSSSQISISVNAPPVPGLFTVTPMSGIAMRDNFLFSCYQWFDIDLPISYQFSFVLVSDQRKNVIKGLSIVSYGISFLPEGNGANNFSLQVVADIYDNMNANYSINSEVFVHKLREETFNLSVYVLTAIKSSQTVDALLQGTSLATVMLNQANCSFAPNCTELNRRSCFYTSHTCGPCLSETMIGLYGDSNSACYENSTQVKGKKLQKCSNNCSGHGSCNFFMIRTNAPLKLCYEGDLSCYARCICDVGYLRSVICDKSDQIIEEKVKLRELVIQGIQSFINRQDDTQQSLSSQVNSLIAISKISEELSSSTVSSLLIIASRILELIKENRKRFMASIDYFPALINGLAEAVIFNQNQISTNNSIYYSQITTISQLLKNYSSLIIDEMVPSQVSNHIIERTFRLIATKLDLNDVETLSEASSCSRNSSVTLPQTLTETYYGLTPTSINFPICTSEPSLSLTASSLYSDLLNISSFLTNPLYLRLSSFPCYNSSLPQCIVQFTIDSADKRAETLFSAKNQTIVCEKGEFTVQEVNCGDGQQNFNVTCRGVAETIVAKCPVHNLATVCREFAMMKETIDIGCKLIYQGTRNLTCSCPLKHSSVFSNSEAQIQSYEVNYVSMLKSTWKAGK